LELYYNKFFSIIYLKEPISHLHIYWVLKAFLYCEYFLNVDFYLILNI